MQLRRVWKPLAFVAVVGAFSLFYSCKKDAFLDKRPIYDTIKWEKKEMPNLKMAKREVLADSAKADTLPAVPLKPRTMVDVSDRD